MSSILASIRIIPVGTGSSSIRSHVDEFLDGLRERGLKCKVNPSCTEICGDWLTIAQAIETSVGTLFTHEEVNRVMCDIHVDFRRFTVLTPPDYCESGFEADIENNGNGYTT